ncbi:pentapeptide repeat-containing protein [Arthrobacter sp. E3]|uniref:pentapeptide repeat-containing protein n=1 Tax=Arthrobacter sp. E3 TaxID=517402 RepID=UPI001A93B7B4|nr:pentapeptide repeat-containing protein [Arthrobacter sp. E3]
MSRYTRAIKQLGDVSPVIRLGGIKALERIAQDSERDRQTILDVLWAYLRSESPLKRSSGVAAGEMKSDTAAAAVAAGRITHLSRPTKLTLLPGLNLSGAILDGADLTDASFDGANLTGASFDGANLDGASFSAANLNHAYLNDANLNLANLTGANLSGGDLIGADLSAADLTRANLAGARLLDANLTHANLTGAILTGTRLTRTNLSGAYVLEKTGDKPMEVPVSRKYLKDKGAKGIQTVKGLPGEENTDAR